MKKIFTIAIVATTILSFASCQKEELKKIDNDSTNTERIISGAFTNDVTKTTLDTDGITPLWSVGDKIRLLDGTSYQDITLASDNITDGGKKITFSTTLTGSQLYAVYPASATTMESCADGSINFTVPSVQDGTFGSANICVASGNGSTVNTIYFSNATAVVEMTVASSVVGTKFAATNNIAGNMTVSMGSNGAITGTTYALSSSTISVSDTKAPSGSKFYLAVAPVETGAVTINCNTNTKFGSVGKDTKTLVMDKIYAMDMSGMTIDTDFDLTGQRGILNGQEYVLIKAKYDGTNDSYLKWATQNLAVTDSGKSKWCSTDYVIGDFFQWAASYEGYGLDGTEGKEKVPTNLVIYTSFTNNGVGVKNSSFTFKTGMEFSSNCQPYDNGSSFTKYNDSDNITTLELTDDVANIVLGDSWRMPTGDNYVAMIEATQWIWDSTDLGYYVMKKGESLDKSNSLLFFPATRDNNIGRYWSSTLDASHTGWAYRMYCGSSSVLPKDNYYRFSGYAVRPVLD